MVLRKKTVVALAFMAVLACAVAAQATVAVDLVPIGNPGNGVDSTDYGEVDYNYQMGKFEVTAGQYTEFLNAVAKTDEYGLYNVNMTTGTWGGVAQNLISRSGTVGNYSYSVGSGWENRPVSYTDWGDAVRFCNWLNNGQPTTGVEDLTTTEDGSYFVNGALNLDGPNDVAALNAVVRKSYEDGARYVLPTYNEWYKAAYHKNNGVTGGVDNYWDFATSSDTVPSNVLTSPDPGNNANYRPSGNASTYTLGLPYVMTPVGEFENSASPYGTFDQNGNVREWTENLADPESPSTTSRIWAGGSAAEGIVAEEPNWQFMKSGATAGNVPGYTTFILGFRIAKLVEPVVVNVTWTGITGTTWDDTTNWSPGNTPNGVTDVFNDTATGLTADIGLPATPTSVVFNNSAQDFTIIGASGIVGAATVLKQGTGTVTMSSANTYSGVTTVEAGKLILTGAAKAMVPVLNNGGADIKGGMLVLDYATEADPVATVKSLLTTSYAAGAWNTGKFQSSSASSSRGLGWNDNTSTSKINIAYTVYGDTNLDGTTNFTDLSKLLSKYGQSGVWADGDANYDGTVNFTDLSKMLSTYGQSVGTLTPSPEPSSIALLLTLAGLVGAWVIRRRGR